MNLLLLKCCAKSERFAGKPNLINMLQRHLIELTVKYKIFAFADRKGIYMRKRGLDRETNKHLLLKHIGDNQKTGSRLKELMDVLPSLSRNQVQTLLREIKRDNLVYCLGRTNAGRWYPRKK